VGTGGALRYTLTNIAYGSIIYIGGTDGGSGTGTPIFDSCTQIATNTYCGTWVCQVAAVTITADTDISIQFRTNIGTCGTWP
jgi:hypothetical protein